MSRSPEAMNHGITQAPHGHLHSIVELCHCSTCGREDSHQANESCLRTLGPDLGVEGLIWILCFAFQTSLKETLVSEAGVDAFDVDGDFRRQRRAYVGAVRSWLLPGGECLLVETPAVSSHWGAVVLGLLVC